MRFPLLPAFLEEARWDVFGALVIVADVAEEEVHGDDDGEDGWYR